MNIKYSTAIILCLAVLTGCSKETISPETFGNIEGQVFDADTEEGVSSVNITTTPATNSIITNPNGGFGLQEVPTGQYTVTAKKSGYETASVNVNVWQSKTASAQIYLNSEGENTAQYFSAQVTAWTETSSNDSTFAEVEYQVTNESEDTKILEYEVYFDIYTPGNTYSQEERDSSLAAGERNIGSFRKYVGNNNSIDSITVSGTYAN
jgi:FlaG/FlaF family flagellin (archaellin)